MMKFKAALLILFMSSILFSSQAFAKDCKYALNIHNSTGVRLYVTDVELRFLRGTIWKKKDVTAADQIEWDYNGQDIILTQRINPTTAGFCFKYRWKYKYKCHGEEYWMEFNGDKKEAFAAGDWTNFYNTQYNCAPTAAGGFTSQFE